LVEIVDYGLRIEFLNSGSPHAHYIIWIKDAPKYDVDNDNVCIFIDQYISCSIPSEEKLHNIYRHIIGRGRPQTGNKVQEQKNLIMNYNLSIAQKSI
jgi:hypothetical protein